MARLVASINRYLGEPVPTAVPADAAVLVGEGLAVAESRPMGTQPVPWDARWVRWPDFRLAADRDDAQDALYEAWRRPAAERVEVACGGGHGRTGTALA